MEDQTPYIATAWDTQTHQPLTWTSVEAVDETDAHSKAREKFGSRLGGYGGWTVTLKQVEPAEVAAA